MARDERPAEKSPEAFRTISEVSETLNIPQHVLRFWETRFSQIRPLKRGGNRRYYRPEDVNLLRAVSHLLYVDGYTIKGVQKLLRENGVRAIVSDVLARTGVAEPVKEAEVLDLTISAEKSTLARETFGREHADESEDTLEFRVLSEEATMSDQIVASGADAEGGGSGLVFVRAEGDDEAKEAAPGDDLAASKSARTAEAEPDEELPKKEKLESLVDELRSIRKLFDEASVG